MDCDLIFYPMIADMSHPNPNSRLFDFGDFLPSWPGAGRSTSKEDEDNNGGREGGDGEGEGWGGFEDSRGLVARTEGLGIQDVESRDTAIVESGAVKTQQDPLVPEHTNQAPVNPNQALQYTTYSSRLIAGQQENDPHPALTSSSTSLLRTLPQQPPSLHLADPNLEAASDAPQSTTSSRNLPPRTAGAASSPLNNFRPSPVITKQFRRYAHPKASKYCHVCARHRRAIEMAPCGNVLHGSCQKSICKRCFDNLEMDWEAASVNHDELQRVLAEMAKNSSAGMIGLGGEKKVGDTGKEWWTCTHCRGVCPERAKCFAYDRQTARRRQRMQEEKKVAAEAKKRTNESGDRPF
eukprot:Plantae.Rhodophyta-Hildenbrandia_rubra.ctg9189.p1 GENE.Plantae.Rhodophyta-Hildenbrandia_rubra.ctg9189~~Plantae.Rhodophyta-Hildenbrandia_rubra.ctg9189.p1  ORF type:complete len:351 (-),score=62.84 Plantae.Rhodophyta-Hildenbrandia_rubra.ctg9189:350-1402(-)